MGKASHNKKNPDHKASIKARGYTPLETHEPPIPVNWPEGHVSATTTGKDMEECIAVRIHEVTHYLHSSTAQELYKALYRVLSKWEDQATKVLGSPPLLWDYMDEVTLELLREDGIRIVLDNEDDGESYDGGYGPGSYFQHAMEKDD